MTGRLPSRYQCLQLYLFVSSLTAISRLSFQVVHSFNPRAERLALRTRPLEVVQVNASTQCRKFLFGWPFNTDAVIMTFIAVGSDIGTMVFE